MASEQPNRSLVLTRYGRRAPRYDRSVAWLAHRRRRAVDRLNLVDAGCGTGLSFELLALAQANHPRRLGQRDSPTFAGRGSPSPGGQRCRHLLFHP
jgi:hypothetical protein